MLDSTSKKIDEVAPLITDPPPTNSSTFKKKNYNLDTWHLTYDTQHVTCDMWCVTCDWWQFFKNTRSLALMVWKWHVAPDIWHLIPDMWHLTDGGRWTFSQNFRFLALTTWERLCYKDFFTKDDWDNELIN